MPSCGLAASVVTKVLKAEAPARREVGGGFGLTVGKLVVQEALAV